MAKTGRPRVKRMPQRTCVGCHQVLAKRALVRLVCGPDGVRVDPTGKANGRGAYLHNQRSCWERALKGESKFWRGNQLNIPLPNQILQESLVFRKRSPGR